MQFYSLGCTKCAVKLEMKKAEEHEAAKLLAQENAILEEEKKLNAQLEAEKLAALEAERMALDAKRLE